MQRLACSKTTKPFPPVYGKCDIIMDALRYLIKIHLSNGKDWAGMKNTLYCKSPWIVKDGLRHNKYGDIQKCNCRDCNRYFTINLGFERIDATPEMVTSAMQLYFTGESLRNVQKFLKLRGIKITHVSIYNWIRKYVGLMKTYPEKITPDVADAWRADEPVHI